MVPLWLGTELGGSLQEYGTSAAGNRTRGKYVMAKGTVAAFSGWEIGAGKNMLGIWEYINCSPVAGNRASEKKRG